MHNDSLAATAAPRDAIAYVLEPSGTAVTYGELEDDSNRYAQLFRHRGLLAGDHVALMLGASASTLKISWAARRAGLVFTVISPMLTNREVAHILHDSKCRLVFLSGTEWQSRAPLLEAIGPDIQVLGVDLSTADPSAAGYDVGPTLARMPAERISDETEGHDMIYSSGTTGVPKGIVVHDRGKSAGGDIMVETWRTLWDVSSEDVYLSTGPLHHSAPLRSCMTIIRFGATAVIMEKFDAALALDLIERHSVTVSQWVPTMFVRMLRLPKAERERHSLRSQRLAIHAAAPCPPDIKEQMITWWGPILFEYFDATESIDMVCITSEEWARHRGSVGKPRKAVIHIMDDAGRELPPGEVGTIYYEGGSTFEYFNDPAKTAAAYNERGWNTVGDVGYLDVDGYLYVTDRKSFMIISGGVNIYPQESESALSGHPAVLDVAVIGIPDDEMGERVHAFVVPSPGFAPSPELADELIAYCRENLARYKSPKSMEFVEALPRSENGKLVKRELRRRYWPEVSQGPKGTS